MQDSQIVHAKGFIRLYDKVTGKELVRQNMILKNSPHITALAFGGEVVKISVKAASWGDSFSEVPVGSYYNMTTLECLEGVHAVDGNHTVKQFAVTGHSFPGSKAIRYTFDLDRNTAEELLDKNLLEWGLYFNDILFSRIALLDDFYFENWMQIAGEWTIIFMSCSGGFSNYILNQYEIASLWGMDYVNSETYTMPDYTGKNDLVSVIPPAKLISQLAGIDPNVTTTDYIHRDALVAFYTDAGQNNVLRINNTEIYNNTLDIDGAFTLWTWFKTKSFDIAPSVLAAGGKWILMSKWTSNDDPATCSYRLYLERTNYLSTIDEVTLKFDINNNGSFVTLQSPALEVDQFATINILNLWCQALVRFDPNTHKLSLFLNGEEMDSVVLANVETSATTSSFFIGAEQTSAADAEIYDLSTTFKGFIDEVAISHESFSNKSVALLWNNGYGDFFNQ